MLTPPRAFFLWFIVSDMMSQCCFRCFCCYFFYFICFFCVLFLLLLHLLFIAVLFVFYFSFVKRMNRFWFFTRLKIWWSSPEVRSYLLHWLVQSLLRCNHVFCRHFNLCWRWRCIFHRQFDLRYWCYWLHDEAVISSSSSQPLSFLLYLLLVLVVMET